MLGVDEKRNRIVAISSEPNARVAALMQVDVQAAMPNMKVLIARPIVFDLGNIVRNLFPNDASATFSVQRLKEFGGALETLSEEQRTSMIDTHIANFAPQIITAMQKATLPTITQIVDVVQQLSNLDWNGVMEGGKKQTRRCFYLACEASTYRQLSY